MMALKSTFWVPLSMLEGRFQTVAHAVSPPSESPAIAEWFMLLCTVPRK